MLTGPPLTPLGRWLSENPMAVFIAKSFLVGYSGQVVLVLGPMMGDFGSIIVAFTHPAFAYAFFNGTFSKGLLAAWAITLANPLESNSTVKSVTSFPPASQTSPSTQGKTTP